MYCKNCGADLPEGRQFCDRCGAAVGAAQNSSHGSGKNRQHCSTDQAGSYGMAYAARYSSKAAGSGQSQAYNSGPVEGRPMFNEASAAQIYSLNSASRNGSGNSQMTAGMNSPIAALKQDVTSKQFIIAAALFSFFAFLSLIQAFAGGNFYSIIKEIVYDSGMNMGGMLGLARFLDILSSFPNLVLAAGLWLIYLPAKDLRNPYFKTTGFSIIKIMTIIQLVIYALTMIVIEIAIIFLASLIEDMIAAFAAAAIAAAGAAVLWIIYYIMLVKVIGGFKNIAEGTTQHIKIPQYVIGLCGLTALSELYTAATDIFSASGFVNVVAGLAAIAGGAAYFILCKMLKDCRKKNKSMEIKKA